MFAKQKYFNRATHSAYGCSSCTANCIRHRFQITQFLTKKLWARITLQIGDSATAVFPYCASAFTKYVLAFHWSLNLTSILCCEFYGHDWFLKLESSKVHLLKLKKNLSYGFELIDIFCKTAILNICCYLKPIYTYKKINSIL